MAKIRGIMIIIILLLGIGILLYPDVMNWQANRTHTGIIQQYNADVALMLEADIAYQLERARIFNEGITDISINDPWDEGANDVVGTDEYYTLLNFNNVMGRIEIPRIRVDLPIFHGSTSDVLDRGVGHMPHTSLPVGGYGNHSILTAHTGMINARLFNDLIELNIGDHFVVTIANYRLAYRVDRVDVVYPHEIDILQTYVDLDLITLVTCTPYGVNSHRLLVRGVRVPYHEVVLDEIEPIENELNIRQLAVIGIVGLITLIALVRGIILKKKRDKLMSSEEYWDQKYETEYHKMFGD